VTEPLRDEFFVGYLPALPPSNARALKRFNASLAVFVLGMSVMLVSLMRQPAAATWDTDTTSIEGTLLVNPYPTVFVDGDGSARAVLVVSTRKFGAAERLAPFDGAMVRLRGTTLRRGDLSMFELADGSEAVVRTGEGRPPPVRDLGRVTVRGEIIDTKCYAGAMKPGEGKIHRDCAVRCISGGIPPALAQSANPELPTVCVLAGPGGQAVNALVLPFVAEQTELEGSLEARGNLAVLRVDEGGIRRLE